MKITKKVLTIVLSLALIFGGISFATLKTASADGDFAITSPNDASLKAAGYFDITWEDASVIKAVDSYDVFVDGSLVVNTTDTKYEFYTTKVNFHKAWIRANFKDGTDHYTKTVRFGVTKKGIATEPNMGCWNIPAKDMGIAWYYNWGRGSYDYHPVYRDLEYVPMIWGTSDDQKVATIINKMNSAISAGSKYMLGYNEPDINSSSGGSDIPNETVIDLWPTFMSFSNRIHVASPAYGFWSDLSDSTFPEFMAAVENNVDVVCLHCYPADWNGGKNMADWMLEKVVDDAYNRYHKPIWITEYSTAGNGITQSGTSSFIRYFLEGLDARDYVERQSFFSFNSATFGGGLYNYSTGELSQSGETYASYGNPETDYVTGPEVNPRDSEEPTTEAPTEQPTTEPATNPDIEQLRQQLEQLAASVNNQITSLNGQISALQSQLSTLESQLEDADDELSSRIDSLSTQLASVKTRLSNAEADVEDILERLSDNSNSIEELETEMQTVQNNLSTIDNRIASANAEVESTVKGYVNEQVGIINDEISSINDSISGLRTIIGTVPEGATLQGEIVDLQNSVQAIENELDSVDLDQIERNKQQLVTLENRMLEITNTIAQNLLTETQNRLNDTTRLTNTINGINESLTAKDTDLQNQVNALNSQLQSTNEDIQNINDAIVAIQNDISANTTSINKNASDIQALVEQLSAVVANLNTVDDRINVAKDDTLSLAKAYTDQKMAEMNDNYTNKYNEQNEEIEKLNQQILELKMSRGNTSVSLSYASKSLVNLSWNKHPYADGYEVYVMKPGNSQYEMVSDTKGLAFGYSIAMNLSYKFMVKAYMNDAKSGKRLYAMESNTATANAVSPAKVVLKKLKAGKKKCTVMWNAVPGVVGYQINYKQKKAKTISVKANQLSTVIKKLKKKKKVTVKVRAFTTYGVDTIYGPWSSAKKVKIK